MNATEQALVSLWGTLSPYQQRQKWALISPEDRFEIERLIPGTEREMIRAYNALPSPQAVQNKGWPRFI